MSFNYNDNIKTSYVDNAVAACPVGDCKRAIRPHGIGVTSHINKHVRLKDITADEGRAIIRKMRGVPEDKP